MDGKLGFCCKYKSPIEEKQANLLDTSLHNTKTTTVKSITNLSRKDLFTKLEFILMHNLSAAKKIINYVGTLPPELKLVRLSSDLLPLYTHPSAKRFWQDPGVQSLLHKEFNVIGKELKLHSIRTGFHPGQFCVLNSPNAQVLENSIKEFEYHIDLARWMGYSKWHEDGFFCNVHVGGKHSGIKSLIKNLNLLSKEALNLITIENDEYSFGIDDYLELAPYVALVLDVHHHWCKTGEYISLDDPRVRVIIESWRGTRPLMHYSVSPREILPNEPVDQMLILNELKSKGFKVKDLRAHSNNYWNKAVNQWALNFRRKFDIELECKDKNLAAIKLLAEIQNI